MSRMMELRIWVVENDLCLLRIWVNFLFYIFLFPFYLYFLFFFFFAAKLELIDVARPRPLADFSSPPSGPPTLKHTHTQTHSLDGKALKVIRSANVCTTEILVRWCRCWVLGLYKAPGKFANNKRGGAMRCRGCGKKSLLRFVDFL